VILKENVSFVIFTIQNAKNSKVLQAQMDYYDDVAEGYEELHRDEQESKLKTIREQLPFKIEPFMKLLDVGCGTGISLEPWQCEKVGVDPSAKLLEKAKAKGFKVFKASAETLPFRDQSFDVVISLTALHHVDYPDDVALELYRVCKQWLIISYLKKADVVHREHLLSALGQYFKKEKVVEHDKDIIYFMSRR
jgi:ubiquinone/menaquinone biosynthesis C-methylase UbiE